MQRLADQIQREVAGLIRSELKDPRLGMVTISAVKVSKDMGYAEIYVTVLGKELDFDPAPSIAVLNNARLRFHYDEVVVRGNRMAELIQHAIAADELAHGNDDVASHDKSDDISPEA